MSIRYLTVVVLVACACLSGCATKRTSLYQWGGYQKNVDAYFSADKLSADAQTQLMEEDLKKIKASGGAVPPGFYAHLGLLHGQQGNLDRFAENVQAERNEFPESQTFMDFLLRNFKK